VGQVIHHLRFDYRGVIVDVDPQFQGSDEWSDRVAQSRPPKDAPGYDVLVHDAEHTTYVAERNLEADLGGGQISHPLLGSFFDAFREGAYHRRAH